MGRVVREAFDREWQLSMTARSAGDLETAVRHLERAHILGQRSTRLHMRSHVGMLGIAWQRSDLREITGQLARIVAAAVFSRLWVPVGNTGGSNVSATRPASDPRCGPALNLCPSLADR